LSKPSLYYYFASKEALVLDLALEALELEFYALTGAVQGVESGAEALVGLVRCRVDFFLDDIDAFRIVHVWTPALGLQDQLARSNTSKQMGALLSGIGNRLNAELNGIRRGARPDVQQLPQIAWALSQGILVQGVTGTTHAKGVEQCRTMRDVACRWLLDSLIE
jgi:AcrR family transcriptional regulator